MDNTVNVRSVKGYVCMYMQCEVRTHSKRNIIGGAVMRYHVRKYVCINGYAMRSISVKLTYCVF